MRTTAHTLILLLALTFAAPLAIAQIPHSIALQGQLFQRTGSPLPDGLYTVSVNLHDGPDGQPITVCDACTVEFTNGVFQVVIGEGGSPLPVMDRQYWVSVSVNGEELLPRIPMQAVPYANVATTAESAPGMVPVGGLIPFAGTTSTDARFIPADGRALCSKDYPDLFAVMGTKWGDGSGDDDPLTDFNVPDTRDVFIRGSNMNSDVATYADPINNDKLRLDNTASGSPLKDEVVSTNELVDQLPSMSFMFLIRVR